MWPWTMPVGGAWCGATRVLKKQKKLKQKKHASLSSSIPTAPTAPSAPLAPTTTLASASTLSSDIEDGVRRILEENRRINDLFERSSKYVSLSSESLQAVQCFPTNSSGQLAWPNCEVSIDAMRSTIRQFIQLDRVHGGARAQTLWPVRLVEAYPFMAGWSLENMLLSLAARVFHARQSGLAWADYIEFFCGRGNLSRAAIMAGLKGLSFDINMSNDDAHNCLTAPGLRMMMQALACTKKGALVWHGTPCSSFTIMCRANSKRSWTNDYLGDQSQPFVTEGNALSEISALTMLLAKLILCEEGLEQPDSSVMPKTPPMSVVLQLLQA